jgi:hypothetical protein
VIYQLVEFLKWTCPVSIFGTIHFQFWGYQDEKVKSANSIEFGQTTWMCRLAWLNTDGGDHCPFQQVKALPLVAEGLLLMVEA